MEKQPPTLEGQPGTSLGVKQCNTEPSDLLSEQEQTSFMSSGNDSQQLKDDDPSLNMQNIAVQTCPFVKAEDEEMSIEPIIQDGRQEIFHLGVLVGSSLPTVQESAVQTSPFVKAEDEEVFSEPVRKRHKSVPLTNQMQESAGHPNISNDPLTILRDVIRTSQCVKKEVEEIPGSSTVKEERNDSYLLHDQAEASGNRAEQFSRIGLLNQLVKSESEETLIKPMPENVVPASPSVKQESEILCNALMRTNGHLESNNSLQMSQAFTTEHNSRDVYLLSNRRLREACSALATTIVQALLAGLKRKDGIKRIKQENMQTIEFVKTETEEISIHPETNNVQKINCRLVKKEEKPLACLPENTLQTNQESANSPIEPIAQNDQHDLPLNNFVQIETDDYLQMSQSFMSEQNAEDLLPRINNSLNQLLPVASDFVKQEHQEVSIETIPQNDDHNICRQAPGFTNLEHNSEDGSSQLDGSQAESELMALFAQLVPALRRQMEETRQIKQENVETFQFIKTEAEEMSIDRITNVVHQINCHLVKVEEKSQAFFREDMVQTSQVIKQESYNSPIKPRNGRHEIFNNFFRNETDDSFQMTQSFSSEQNAEDLLPHINESLNRQLPVEENTVNLSHVKQEDQEMSMEIETQYSSQTIHNSPQSIPEETSQVRTSQSVKAEAEERSFEQESQVNVVRPPPAFANTEQNSGHGFAQRADSLREACSELVAAIAQLILEIRTRQEERRRIRQEKVKTEAEEMPIEPNQNAHQINGQRRSSVLKEESDEETQGEWEEDPQEESDKETQNGQHEPSNQIIKNKTIESLQMRQFIKEEPEEDTQDAWEEETQDAWEEEGKDEWEEQTQYESDIETQNGQPEPSNQIIKNKTIESLQVRQFIKEEPEEETQDAWEEKSQDEWEERTQYESDEETQNGQHEPSNQIIKNKTIESLQMRQFIKEESEEETQDESDEETQDAWEEESQDELEEGTQDKSEEDIQDGSNMQNAAEETSIEPTQNVVSVKKEEDEDQFPISPENAFSDFQFIKQESPNSSIEPMIQSGQHELSNQILRQYIKEESEEHTQNEWEEVTQDEWEEETREEWEEHVQDESDEETQHESNEETQGEWEEETHEEWKEETQDESMEEESQDEWDGGTQAESEEETQDELEEDIQDESNMQNAAEGRSMKPNQNVVSVKKEEDENQFPISPENAFSESPNSSIEPMIQNGQHELLNQIVRQYIKEESEDDTQDEWEVVTPDEWEEETQDEWEEETPDESEEESENGQHELSNRVIRNEMIEYLQMRQFIKEESEEDTQDEWEETQVESEEETQNDCNEMPRQNALNLSTEATSQCHQNEDDSFSVTHHNMFNSIEIKHNLQFSGDASDFGAYYTNIMNTLEVATKKMLSYAKRGDKIQIELRNADIQNNVCVTLAHINDLSCWKTLFDRLGEANTSVNHLEMVVQIVKVPVGGVKRKHEDTADCEEFCRKRKHLHIQRHCENQLSFAISLAHCLNPDINDSQATYLGAEMQRRVGLTDQTPVALADISKFELLLNRKIIVFYRQDNAATCGKFMTLFRRTEDPPVYLYLEKNQYIGIGNITAFLGCSYFCDNCFQELGSIENHSCPRLCPICLDPGCISTDDQITCKDCHRKCNSHYCYEAHKKPKWCPKAKLDVAECDSRKKCNKCGYVYFIPLRVNFNHECLLKHCSTCGMKLDNNRHKCYILPLPGVQNHNETKLIFYEFKTYVNESRKRVPFVLSAKTLQGKTWTVYGERCIVDFLLHFKSETFCGTTFVSHHTDSSILLDNMTEVGLTPNVITQKSQIVCIELPDFKQKFVDAAMFLPMPLATLPEMFKINTYKGFFPVGFISKENLQYVGPCPGLEFYAVDEMSEKQRQEFDETYHLASICEFDFKREAQIYCEDDVDILTSACIKLRTFFINGYNVDPFSCTTLQSFGMNVFCTKFLPESTLAIPLSDDYKPKKKASTDASIEWLEWVMFSEMIFIQHALNKGKKKATHSLFVDGYSQVKGEKVIWEFVDCQKNGCPACFPNVDHGERYRLCEERLTRLEFLSDLYNVKLVVMREHTWNEMKKSDALIQDFLKHYKPPQPLSLQELSYANMNGVVKLQYSAASDEEIMFSEVDSLFPYVMANNTYPTGHPKLIFEKFAHPRSYFGLIKAVVSPPKDLLFPVLPYKTANGKTVFALCRSCADMNQQGPCNHKGKDRALTGVWVTPEFNKALQMGYKLRSIIEVWHFESKSNTIFEDFVSNFVKGKQGGLDSTLAVNPAKKHIYKSSLDEFWQGFGDRSPQLQSKTVTRNEDFMKLMFSAVRKVEFFKILSNKTALVEWTSKQNSKSLPKKTDNVFVSAFTAAYGRLHLYNILEKLQEKVLYYDTDRVIYVAKHGKNELDFGSEPGQLTDKLGGDTIQEFVSVGSKCYGYQTKTKQVVMNVKGITQTLDNCQDVNFSVKDVVRGNVASSDKDEREMIKAVYDQRQLLPNGNTVPFGYRLDCISTLDWALNQIN